MKMTRSVEIQLEPGERFRALVPARPGQDTDQWIWVSRIVLREDSRMAELNYGRDRLRVSDLPERFRVMQPFTEPVPGSCWNCGRDGKLGIRPDAGMRNVTDEVVCGACGEVQP